MEVVTQLKKKVEAYQSKEDTWRREKEVLQQKIRLLEQEVLLSKAGNQKKPKHKRAASQEHTFIFNQTNISSYFPVLIVKPQAWNLTHSYKSHLDTVRSLAWVQQSLVSGGQDFLLKVSDKDKQRPPKTIREHLGPVYVIESEKHQVLTGGAEGVLRSWSEEKLLAGKTPCAQIELHEDVIWDISMNPYHSVALTSSSDDSVKLTRISDVLTEVSAVRIQKDTPTAVKWLSATQFLIGFVNSHKISLFDSEKLKRHTDINFNSYSSQAQANRIIHSEDSQTFIAGHEDKVVRLFDLNSGQTIHTLTAHSDAVTSVVRLSGQHSLATCSHDGSLRIWDLRKERCLNDIPLRMRKFDEAALCMSYERHSKLLAVGGADGQIKLFHPEE